MTFLNNFTAQVFFQMDLVYHLRVAEDSIHLVAFKGLDFFFGWLVMPFGLTNAPAYFVDFINHIFGMSPINSC